MRIKLSVLIIVMLLSVCTAPGQIKGLSNMDPSRLMQQSVQANMQANQLLQAEQLPVGNPVSPEHYLIGPQDILSLLILPFPSTEQIIPISPEYMIMIPRIGAVDLKGKTLAEARETVREAVLKSNPNAIVSLTLRQARLALVTIKGAVTLPGTYYLPASYRVSTALKYPNQTKINNQVAILQSAALLRKQEYLIRNEKYYSESGIARESNYVLRNIAVLHSDGSSQTADLLKAAALSSPEFDPYIREGDVIVVPFEKNDYPKISISGAVMSPAIVVYKEGDKASTLLKMAYGAKDNADLNNVHLINSNGGKTPLKVDSALRLLSQDYPLKPGSAIIVGEKPIIKNQEPGVASIKGEVKNPGVYPIQVGKTRLRDLVNDAGGLTSGAYLPLATIIRSFEEDISTTNYRSGFNEYFQYSDLTLEDTMRYYIDVLMRLPVVSCDFVAALAANLDKDNVILESGDVVNIPVKPSRVYVFGQVKQPGYVEFSDNKTLEWYIKKAGGCAEGAVKQRARIIRGKTKVWVESGLVFAGDAVYVPREPNIPQFVKTQTYSVYASVLLAVVSVASILVNILTR